ncbi:ABC transporter ATP-binding protein [Streptomyces sp. NPDC005500]|uniref:ABC transporter ATP-binding protein n=1 Tax=Streptomyces sp. NPDC005500 TaxID=3155007 RepID=UPI0033A329DC
MTTPATQRGGPAPAERPARITSDQQANRPLNFKDSSKRLLKLMHPERILLCGALVCTTLSVAMNVAGPRILGTATDLVFAGIVGRQSSPGLTKDQALQDLRDNGDGKVADMLAGTAFTPGRGIDFDSVGGVLLIALGLFLGTGLLMLAATQLSNFAINRAQFRLREQVQAKLAHLPLSYFDQRQRGEVLSRATNDIDNIGQTLQQTLAQLMNALLTIIGVLSMTFWISPLLALVALVTVPLSATVATRVGKLAQPHFVQQWKTTGTLNGHIEEMYTGHTLVKVFGRQQETIEAFRERNEALHRASFKAQFISGTMQPLLMLVSNLNYVLIAVVGGLRVATGTLSIGEAQAFIQYSRQLAMPLTQVASMANLVQSGVASAERVFEFLDAPEQSPEPTIRERPERLRGEVSLEKVSFRYDLDKPLIDDLSLRVEPGHTVAVVGPTGAGKTTLVNLLMRFYEVTGGRITLDGTDIATMSREDLRSGIGMVLQDTWLFGGTIADNIAYGASRDVTREEIEEAARAAHADRFIRTLPEGYDTVLSDDGAEGSGVSAGEKQLITIARAFLSDPVILVLDEATSSVDTRTEVLIQKAMARLAHGRTSFVIAHRLSTIRDADVILVMENGAIVEQGSHDELLAARGAYARLYAAQFAQATTFLT